MSTFIAWFVQNVWPNIVASLLWAVPGYVKLHKIHRQAKRTHDHVVRQMAYNRPNKGK